MSRSVPFKSFFKGPGTSLVTTFEIRPRGVPPIYLTDSKDDVTSDVGKLPASLLTGIWTGGRVELREDPENSNSGNTQHMVADIPAQLASRGAINSAGNRYDPTLIDSSAFEAEHKRVYKANAGFTRAALGFTWDLDPADTDLDGLDEEGRNYATGEARGNGITPDLLETGACDGAPVIVGVISHKYPDYGPLPLFVGHVETVEYEPFKNKYRLGLRGYKEALRAVSNKAYSRVCRARLGDGDCRMNNRSSYRTDPNTNQQIDEADDSKYYFAGGKDAANSMYNTRRFESRWAVVKTDQHATRVKPIKDAYPNIANGDKAYLIAKTRLNGAIDINTFSEHKKRMDPRFPGKDWFKGGHVRFAKDGLLMDLGDAQVNEFNNDISGSYPLPTALPPPRPLEVGEVVYMYPGCAKTLVACDNWFHNSDNFRGEPSRYAPKTSPELLEDVEDGNVEIRYYAKPRFRPSAVVVAGTLPTITGAESRYRNVFAPEPTGEDPPYEDWEWQIQPPSAVDNLPAADATWYGVYASRTGAASNLPGGQVLVFGGARPGRSWTITFNKAKLRKIIATDARAGSGLRTYKFRLRARARKLNTPRAKWSDWVKTPDATPLTVKISG